MHQGIGEANVGRVPTAVNGCFGVNTAAAREVLVVVVVSATCRGTRYDVLLRRHDDIAQPCMSQSGEARAEGTGGPTKGITPRVSRDQVDERRGFQRSATCGEAMLATPFHAETTVAEAKALHGVATMDEAKAPQRARMRFDTDGKGAAARTVDQQKAFANACCKHARSRGGMSPLVVERTGLPIDGVRAVVGA